jgi:hypothetical protein
MVWWEAQHAAVPPAVSGTPDCNLRRDGARRKLLVTERGRGDEPMPLDQPRRVVGFVERQQRLTQVLDGLAGADPEQVLLERPNELLGTAISLGCTDEGR